MIKTKEDLKKFRLKYGKTQEQFARDLGVSLSYYTKVECGRLAFYDGIKKSANDFEARIKAYEKATDQYIEVQKKTENKEIITNKEKEEKVEEVKHKYYIILYVFIIIFCIVYLIF